MSWQTFTDCDTEVYNFAIFWGIAVRFQISGNQNVFWEMHGDRWRGHWCPGPTIRQIIGSAAIYYMGSRAYHIMSTDIIKPVPIDGSSKITCCPCKCSRSRNGAIADNIVWVRLNDLNRWHTRNPWLELMSSAPCACSWVFASDNTLGPVYV